VPLASGPLEEDMAEAGKEVIVHEFKIIKKQPKIYYMTCIAPLVVNLRLLR